MAGMGSRFSDAGYLNPKPFIDVNGLPMIEQVLKNLSTNNARFILIAREEHAEEFRSTLLELKSRYNLEIVALSKMTEGTACTVLKARKFINNDHPLVIANCDQLVDMSFVDFIKDAEERKLDGSILTFVDSERNPKWSFAKLDSSELVTEVKEKVAISEYATIGIYYFKKGKFFVNSAIDMIVDNDRVNNEFYTCPAYNYMIKDDAKVGIYNIPEENMHGLGTPDDLNLYLSRI